MNRHAPRKVRVVSRDTLYADALQKLFRSQRPNDAERRELRRRQLADGSYPVPT